VSALAIVQARASSTRLAGKVLADVGGEPLLAFELARLRAAQRLDRVVVATSTRRDDDPVAALADELGVGVHRGPLEDVLGRFAGAAAGHDGVVVRLTGDCPLIDPTVVDAVVERLERSPEAVYASNVEPRRTFPHGLDVEAIRAETLAELDRDVTDPELREHVTLAARRAPERFPAVTVTCEEDLSELRWTVDLPADLEFVRRVTERLGPARHTAPWREVRAAAARPPSLDGLGGYRRA
jgi:spore coat polysaccharide biosynthesis protein SpsF